MSWMERENVILGEISLSDKDKYQMISLTHGNKTKQSGGGGEDSDKQTLTGKQTEGFQSKVGNG